MARRGQTTRTVVNEIMEKENDDMTDKLASKVEMLRQISVNIGKEVDEQNTVIDDYNTSAGDIMGSFKGTMKGLATLATSGGTQALLVKSMGLFGFFLVVYYLSSRYTADP
ncbi:hypothetical protein AAMO2058_000824800 [Amorphochlora amoebiformis]